MGARGSRSRRWVFTCLILVVAAIFLWWDRRTAGREIAEVQALATKVCTPALRDAFAPDVPEALLMDAIDRACAEADRRLETRVRRGFCGSRPDDDSDECYCILLRTQGETLIGLQVSTAVGAPLIVGYWTPSPTTEDDLP